MSIVAGDVGKAGVFNGSDTYVNFGNTGNTENPFTIGFKFKKSASVNGFLFYKSGNSAMKVTAANKVQFTFWNSGNPINFTSTSSFENGAWYTVVVWYDGSNLKIYKNGILDADFIENNSIDANTNDVLIGSDLIDFFNGQIETVCYYFRALTSDEINIISYDITGNKKFVASNAFAIGDLLQHEKNTDREGGEAVTFVSGNFYWTIPIYGIECWDNIMQTAIGNIYQTARQKVLYQKKDMLGLYEGIETFADLDDETKIVWGRKSDGTAVGGGFTAATVTQMNTGTDNTVAATPYNLQNSKWGAANALFLYNNFI